MRNSGRSSRKQLDALGQRYRDIANKLPPQAEEWHREMARQAYADHQELLSGTTKTAQLRKDGNPFAKSPFKGGRRSGQKRVARPQLPINEQTGRLKRGLFLQESLFIGQQSIAIGSVAPYAKYILDPRGTRKMIGRGLMTGHAFSMTTPGEIELRWRARHKIFNDRFRRGIQSK